MGDANAKVYKSGRYCWRTDGLLEDRRRAYRAGCGSGNNQISRFADLAANEGSKLGFTN